MQAKHVFKFSLIFCAICMLAGCAQLTHYNKQKALSIGGGETILADAKQRAILSAQRPSEKTELLRQLRLDALEDIRSLTKKLEKADRAEKDALRRELNYKNAYINDVEQILISGEFTDNEVRLVAFCAEPSPDALSALSASGGLDANSGNTDVGLQLAVAEAAGSIGLRTQSIQLMRDAMYRLCEGHMNGALGNAAYETLHRRFQNSMVAILAIEQLTGSVRAPAIQLSSGASVGAAQDVTELTKMVSDARTEAGEKQSAASSAAETMSAKEEALKAEQAKLPEFESELKTLEAKTGDDAPTEQQLSTARTAVETQKQTIASATSDFEEAQQASQTASKNYNDAQENVRFLEQALDAAKNGRATAQTRAYLEEVSRQNTMDSATAWYISDSVRQITKNFYDQGFFQEVCTTVFTSLTDGELSALEAKAFFEPFEYQSSSEDDGAQSSQTLMNLCRQHLARVSEEEREANLEERRRIAQDRERFAEERLSFDQELTRLRSERNSADQNLRLAVQRADEASRLQISAQQRVSEISQRASELQSKVLASEGQVTDLQSKLEERDSLLTSLNARIAELQEMADRAKTVFGEGNLYEEALREKSESLAKACDEEFFESGRVGPFLKNEQYRENCRAEIEALSDFTARARAIIEDVNSVDLKSSRALLDQIAVADPQEQ